MTLEEKVGQLVTAFAYGHYISTDSQEYARLARLVQERHVGGMIMSLGDVYGTAVLLNKLQRLAKVPLLVGADLERGLAMRTRKTTPFPDAMAIGATRDPAFAYKAGRMVAEEARAIGIHQNYAPVADVNTNPANPVINTRSFGDRVQLVQSMVAAFVRGTNDGGIVSTAKHFPGHGDTGVDSHLDLPILALPKNRLDSLELATFRTAIDSGVMSVMMGHLSVPALDSTAGLPASLSTSITQGVLEGELGFRGLIVSDALDMQGIIRNYSIGRSAIMAVNAGTDLLLMPANDDVALNALLAAARNGDISTQRLDAAVRKVLETKQRLGLHKERLVDLESIGVRVATRYHWDTAREIARHAITVLRNDGGILPLPHAGKKSLVSVILNDVDENRTDVNRPSKPFSNEPAGADFTHQLQRRYGGIETYRLSPLSNRLDFDSVFLRVKQADLAIVSLFMKVRTASGRIGMPENLRVFANRLRDLRTPTVVIAFGSPYTIANMPNAKGIVCAYGDSEVLVDACAEAIFGETDVHGELPVSIPGQFTFGDGLDLNKVCLRKDDPLVAGFDPARLSKIDDIVNAGIRNGAFPCAQVLVAREGLIVYDRAFGTYTYDAGAREIDESSLFDLASVTKVIATTAAVMKLYDEGRLNLDDPVSKYIPQYAQGAKARVTLRHLMLHRGGLPPFKKLWEICKTPQEALDSVFATQLVAAPGDSTIYSDLGLITMGKIVEKITGMTLDSFVLKEYYAPLKMNNTFFNPSHAIWSHVVPTEYDSVWRKELVRGTVHDENASFIGGVSGHAGLFSTASDLAVFMQMLMNNGTYGGVQYLGEKTIVDFIRTKSPGQERWIGWDMRSPVGSSSGQYFSASSFGHTGFTGTSIWADPERHLFVIFLTNRVYPTRANSKISKVRPQLHDAVMRALLDGVTTQQ